jgi:DNA-binding transcriptional ArsR family regulator
MSKIETGKIETGEPAAAPFAYDGLDRVIHEKARLGLLTSLIAHPKGLAFADLKQLCGLTDGNLSRHLQVLQEAGLVEIRKGYEGNRPQTTCGLTDGNLSRHLQVLQEAGLVEIRKGYEGNRPQTTCGLTAAGRRRFLDYLAVLERVVRDAAEAARDADAPPEKPKARVGRPRPA